MSGDIYVCVCDPTQGPNAEGPSEHCPQHGNPRYWAEVVAERDDEIERLQKRPERNVETAELNPDFTIYDEDGYCAACGNGHWKAHMPGCEIADLADKIERLRAALGNFQNLALEAFAISLRPEIHDTEAAGMLQAQIREAEAALAASTGEEDE